MIYAAYRKINKAKHKSIIYPYKFSQKIEFEEKDTCFETFRSDP